VSGSKRRVGSLTGPRFGTTRSVLLRIAFYYDTTGFVPTPFPHHPAVRFP